MNPNEPIQSAAGQIWNFLDLLSTPTGMIIAIIFVAVILPLVLFYRQLRWTVLALLLWATTFSFTDLPGYHPKPLMFPLQDLKYQGRGLSAAFMTLLLINCLGLTRGWRQKIPSSNTVLLLMFQVVLAGRSMLSGDIARGAGGGLLFAITFFIFGVMLPRALQTWGNALAMVRSIAAFGIIFLGVNLMQIAYDSSAVASGTRFLGTTGNPQHAALTIAGALPAIAYLIARPGRSKLSRLFVGCCAGFFCVLLVWRGSRTGLIMSVTSMVVLFRRRLGRLLASSILVGAFVLFALQMLNGKARLTDRIIDTSDSRTGIWLTFINAFLENPLTGDFQTEGSESSYLAILARYGIIGALPFVLVVGSVVRSAMKMNRGRRHLNDPMLADLVLAGLASLGVGAIFEGSLLGMLNTYILLIYLYLALASFLSEYSDAMQEENSFEWLQQQQMSLGGHSATAATPAMF